MKPKFIVFEGIDGSGTSTQSDMLRDYLIGKGDLAHLSSEPSGGPIGNFIRQSFKGRIQLSKGPNPNNEKLDLFDEQMAYLFAADRHDHLYNATDGVYKLTSEGASVICTRYFFSSIAYNSSNQNEFDFVWSLNRRFPYPDLVIYLDNPVEVSLSRMGSRSFKDEYENGDKLTTVKENYEKIFSDYSGEFLRVDATLPPSEIHKIIVDHLEN